jgi:hypothetical protein
MLEEKSFNPEFVEVRGKSRKRKTGTRKTYISKLKTVHLLDQNRLHDACD